jgi:hypothetical protein
MSNEESTLNSIKQKEQLKRMLLQDLREERIAVRVDDCLWVITYRDLSFKLGVEIYQPKIRMVTESFHPYFVLRVDRRSMREEHSKLIVRGKDRSFRPALAAKRIREWLDSCYDDELEMQGLIQANKRRRERGWWRSTVRGFLSGSSYAIQPRATG